MHERAQQIGGTLSIQSSGDGGTTIELVVSAHG
jgi:signal transduction histidine kinase